MTPTALYELVKDMPEVLPEGMRIHPEQIVFQPPNCGWCELDPIHAADLICGQAKRMMKDGYKCGVVSTGCFARVLHSDNHYAPTELEAVLAAYTSSKAPRIHSEAKQP